MSPSIWWIRRDLRLRDNQAVSAAVQTGSQVIPVFILDPALLHSPYTGSRRLSFLVRGLQKLDASLRQRGSFLVVRKGRPQDELVKLVQETGASAVYAEADYSPYARRRDDAVARRIPLQLLSGLCVQPPGSVMTAAGEPYTVYSPFARRWRQTLEQQLEDPLPAPVTLQVPPQLDCTDLPTAANDDDATLFPAGEDEAWDRLEAFLNQKAAAYESGRNRLDENHSSVLSPYLRFGMISARSVLARLLAALPGRQKTERDGLESWLAELIWRDFFIHLLFHFPEVRHGNFHQKYDGLPWSEDKHRLDAWRSGQTGYPVVDAAMRQLNAEGWIANRARMIVASFLVKDLLIDWREGERWFMQQLIDGDPAANNGNWQWVAGTGAGAAPYYRIFNPVLQSKKFDPHGQYIRRWVPELQRLPESSIHEPWKLSAQKQQENDFILGRHYPYPIVDHQAARQKALAAYSSI